MARFFPNPGIRTLALAALTALAASSAHAQGSGAPGVCSVAILSAGSGGGVSQTDTISGVATLPSGVNLWIFTQVKGSKLWWAQGGGDAARVAPGGGQWTASATFGLPQEAGKDFNIAAVPVDDDTDVSLTMSARRANAKHNYPGMALPASADNCRAAKVTVHRVQ